MTQILPHESDVDDTAAPVARRPWWRRPWILPLAVVIGAFLAYSLPPYLSLDPAESVLPLNAAVPLHYPLLLLHVFLGSVTLVTVLLQLWPGFRRRSPRAHRIVGRVYVFGGMLPAAVLALMIMPLGGLTAIGLTGTVGWATLGVTTTLAGFQAARRGALTAHRRWMVYSFAVAMAPMTGRGLFYVVLAIPGLPQLPAVTGQLAGYWLGWLVNLVVAHLWLRRHPALSAEDAPANGLPAGERR